MIDWDQVRQLEEDIGAEDFGEVVELFIAEVDEAIEALPNVPVGNGAELAPALHFLKGSAYNLGFKSFGDLCSEGEKNASNGNASEVDVAAVIDLYAASKDVFVSQAPNHCAYRP